MNLPLWTIHDHEFSGWQDVFQWAFKQQPVWRKMKNSPVAKSRVGDMDGANCRGMEVS